MGQKQNKVAQERQAEDSLGQAEGIWTHNSFANLSILSIWFSSSATEIVNRPNSDHIFKHDTGAIECFLLVVFLAYNIFHVFLARNVKPSIRHGKTQIFWARLIAAELYSEVAPAGMSP